MDVLARMLMNCKQKAILPCRSQCSQHHHASFESPSQSERCTGRNYWIPPVWDGIWGNWCLTWVLDRWRWQGQTTDLTLVECHCTRGWNQERRPLDLLPRQMLSPIPCHDKQNTHHSPHNQSLRQFVIGVLDCDSNNFSKPLAIYEQLDQIWKST